jgi:hypothetical protein
MRDPGLACHLLGIESERELARSPFVGALFEGLVASEIAKAQANAGRGRSLYHFRDQQGLEVDFVVPAPAGALALIECKASYTVVPSMAAPMRRLAEAIAHRGSRQPSPTMTVVHQPAKNEAPMSALAPGVRAVSWRRFVDEFNVR